MLLSVEWVIILKILRVSLGRLLKGVSLSEILLVELKILRDCSVYIDICLHLGLLIDLCGLLLLGNIVLCLIVAENTSWFILRIVVENVIGRLLSIVSKGVLYLSVGCSLLSLAAVVENRLWHGACWALILVENVIASCECFVGGSVASKAILSICEQYR